jgi:hypothetical protein
MKILPRLCGAALVAALLPAAVVPVFTDLAPAVSVPGIDKPVIVVTGEVTGAETWVNSNYYVLRGAVFVREGATLTIQAGTTVIGETGSVGALVVSRGGRIIAIGTPEQPIVFTGDQAPGTRNRGDWGGLIINGYAPINQGGGENEGEADTGIYGGTDPNDNSGVLRYVRVEFAGALFSPDNEMNGIALQGVGRGTTMDHVQVHMNKDDGIEFFGGTADVKYAVVSNAADDSLDWTFGWIGRAQFVAIHQRGDDGDRGIEADNNEFGNNLEPRSNPQIYNLTMCGDPFVGAESTVATTLRRGTALTLRNFLITGFKTQGLTMETSNSDTLNQVNNGTTQIGAGVVWGMPTPVASALAPFVASGRFPDVRSSTVNNPGFAGLSADCFNHASPNFQPTSIATLAGGQMAPIQPPNDGFFEAVTFIGAVPPAPEPDWTQGWTSYPAN